MSQRKKVILFLILNVVVSALTVWGVLSLWLQANPLPQNLGTPPPGIETAGSSTNSPTPTGTPGSGPIPGGQLEIANVVGAGDLDSERVQIRHIGDAELSLAGWALRDAQGSEFIFPGLTMFSGGAVTVYTKPGSNTVIELYWGMTESVWDSGEVVTLLDPEGTIQALFMIP